MASRWRSTWPVFAVSDNDTQRWCEAVRLLVERRQHHKTAWAVSVLWTVMHDRLLLLQEQEVRFGHVTNPCLQQFQNHVCNLFPDLKSELPPHVYQHVPFDAVCASVKDAVRTHVQQQHELEHEQHRHLHVTSRFGARFGYPWLCTPACMAFLIPCTWFLMLFDDAASASADACAHILALLFPLHACRSESPLDMFQRLRVASTLYRMIVASGCFSRQHDQWSMTFDTVDVAVSSDALASFARNVGTVVAQWTRPCMEEDADVHVVDARGKAAPAVDRLLRLAEETAPYLIETMVLPPIACPPQGSPWHTSPFGPPRVVLFREHALSARVLVEVRQQQPHVPPCPARVHAGACCALLGGVPSLVLAGPCHAQVRKCVASACRMLPAQHHRQLLCYSFVSYPTTRVSEVVLLFVREATWEAASKPTQERLLRLFAQLRRLWSSSV